MASVYYSVTESGSSPTITTLEGFLAVLVATIIYCSPSQSDSISHTLHPQSYRYPSQTPSPSSELLASRGCNTIRAGGLLRDRQGLGVGAHDSIGAFDYPSAQWGEEGKGGEEVLLRAGTDADVNAILMPMRSSCLSSLIAELNFPEFRVRDNLIDLCLFFSLRNIPLITGLHPQSM